MAIFQPVYYIIAFFICQHKSHTLGFFIMKLTDISYVKELMRENGINFKKQFGQNFLINPEIPERIANDCQQDTESAILEIGPGIGTLTRSLCERFSRVLAVEIDTGLMPILKQTLADFDNVKVINQDILKTDIAAVIKEHFGNQKVSVCANLPYYITTPVIVKLLESSARFDTITVMVQKEVAIRLCADHTDKEWSAISAFCSYYAASKRLFDVSAGNFLPPPKICSTVMQFQPYVTPPVQPKNTEFMFLLIKKAFEQRRKTLINALSGISASLSKEDIRNALLSLNLNENVRGEVLSLQNFADLSDILEKRAPVVLDKKMF